MKRQWKEDSFHNYCVLGPHRIKGRGHVISSAYLYSSFKAYIGDSWNEYHPEAELCNKCQAKIRNFGRREGIQPEGSATVQPSEDIAPATPNENEMMEEVESSNAEDSSRQSPSSENFSISSGASFYSAQDVTPSSSHSHFSHRPGSEGSSPFASVESSSAAHTTYQLSSMSNACKVVGELIHKYFTPQNLGFGSISKEDVIHDHNRKTTQIALSIPEGKIISIADGTYLYVDKPVGHAEQRLTWNAQKMCNFYRMMMIVACSGRVLDCIGPFPATWNDSKALEWIMENTGFLDFMGDGTLILDRGFKSCEPKLREKGLTVYSPEWLGPNEKQMNVEKGAKSRLVTMCRWQVEGANGRVKQKFRFFMNTIPGRYSVNISRWFMNVCAILNKYGACGFTETDRNIGFAKEAVERAKIDRNELCDRLRDSGKIKCTAAWKKMDATCLTDFPRLAYDDLESASLGSYHANEARRYITEHLKPTGLFELRYHREFPDIVRTQIHSRFQSATIHSAWIRYLPDQNGPAAIVDHYCTCRAGARIVSCCAHIATALRFLGLDRYVEDLVKRKSHRVKFLGISYPDSTT